MMTGLFHAHSHWRYIVIVTILITLIRLLMSTVKRINSNENLWTKSHKTLCLLSIIAVDIQLLTGVILWLLRVANGGIASLGRRLWEHPFIMILGVVFLHIAYKQAKKAPEDKKLTLVTIWYASGAFLLFAGILHILRMS